MRKIYSLLILLIVSCCLSFGQTTAVTATVTYPDGNAFTNGTVQAVFTPPTGIIDQHLYLLNGSPFPYFVNGVLDNTGTFTLNLTDDHVVRPVGGRWSFTVCSPASVPCTVSLQDVFGSSINLSSAISADAAAIFASALSVPTYFQDSEVDANSIGGQIYFNYVSKQLRCWDGSTFSNCLGGGGGSGTVTTFSAGNLSPLFTTNVTNPTTTPSLIFTLTNAPANTVLGNYSGVPAAPIYEPLTFLGNTTQVATTTGSYTPGDCVTIDVNNNFIDSGAGCGGGGGGGTPGGPQFSVQFNNPLGTFDGVSGLVTDILGNLTALSLSTTGTNGGYWLASEGTDPSLCAANKDLIYANATNHVFQICNNNGTQDKIAAVNGAVVSGHYARFGATSYEIFDAGSNIDDKTRVCLIPFGSNNGTVLADADLGPQVNGCWIPYVATINEIEVKANAGTPNIIIAKDHLGATTNLLSSAQATAAAGGRACANTGGTLGIDGATTCSSKLSVTSLAQGDYIFPLSGTAGGVANAMIVSITFTVTN